MKVKSIIAAVFFSILAGTLINSAQALQHAAPDALAAYNQGNINEAVQWLTTNTGNGSGCCGVRTTLPV